MNVKKVFGSIQPEALFASHLVETAEVFLKEAASVLTRINLTQQDLYALCKAVTEACNTDPVINTWSVFFSNLWEGVEQQEQLSLFSVDFPLTSPRGCEAGLILARHFRTSQKMLAKALTAGVALLQDRTFPNSIRLAHFDSRIDLATGKPVTEATVRNNRFLSQGLCFGFEITEKMFAEQVDANLDPQHTGAGFNGLAPLPIGADTTWSTTKWSVELIHLGWKPPGGSTLVGFKIDLDTAAAMALFWGRFTSDELKRPDIENRLRCIDSADNFKTPKSWVPQKPYTLESPWGKEGDSSVSELHMLAAINAVAQDNSIPLERRIDIVVYWIRYGEALIGPIELLKARQKVDSDRHLLLSSIRHEVIDGICIIESEGSALSVGYKYAPIVIAYNPTFRGFGMHKWLNPGLKYTIGSWGGQWLVHPDKTNGIITYPAFSALVSALNEKDPAACNGNYWGGNASSGIIGSPQGSPSGLTPDQVLYILLNIQNTFKVP